MKHKKYLKHKNRSSRIFAPVHINSNGVIDYKLPLCDFIDSIISKKPFRTEVITEDIDGKQYYYEYEFNGKNVIVSKSLINNYSPELKLIQKYRGNNLVKEFHNGFIVVALYDHNRKVTDTVYYKKDLNLNADMVIESSAYFYRLPLCEFIDNTIMKNPDILKIIYFNFEGQMHYIILEFNGKDIIYTKYEVNNSKLENKKKAIGNKLVTTSTGGNNNYLELYDNENFVKPLLAYSNKFIF